MSVTTIAIILWPRGKTFIGGHTEWEGRFSEQFTLIRKFSGNSINIFVDTYFALEDRVDISLIIKVGIYIQIRLA